MIVRRAGLKGGIGWTGLFGRTLRPVVSGGGPVAVFFRCFLCELKRGSEFQWSNPRSETVTTFSPNMALGSDARVYLRRGGHMLGFLFSEILGKHVLYRRSARETPSASPPSPPRPARARYVYTYSELSVPQCAQWISVST